ncbi:hypothetical protein FHL15_005736 [Xylaria flabelliformis]|uniref:Uncharacterized protein n=1 Tax=Xylaria flabelliformis TaxID=2512241 RepID=A0A553HZU9_9PEZI|nr:hypothetical protein FHL15_005736 [Xylaria flabelliformis]
MSPTYTMSAHLCKEIYKSFQNRQTSPEPSHPNRNQAPPSSWMTRRSPSPNNRTSVDSDRSDSSSASSTPMSRSPSSSSWSWGSR